MKPPTAPMDEGALKLGLFMEAAHANQRAAESSLRKLKAFANDLASVVRDEVHSTLTAELQSLAQDSKRASDALHALQRTATIRAFAWSVCITLLCSAIPFALAYWIMPSRAEIAALRVKHDELAAQIARLEQSGALIDLRRCGEGGRLCVRVDRKAPIYGEQSDYLIVRGY
jgi:hypothetical protein